MRVNKNLWKIKESDFGPLLPYIKNDNITDINYNGTDVWVDDLTRGRYKTDIKLSNSFIERFSTRVADTVSASFNQYNPVLEAETDTLRISIVHEEYANTGRTISIRKTPIVMRLNREKMLSEGYCSEEFLDFVEQCVKAKMNMLMCGLPGTGKTEFLKYLTSFIPAHERAITIEDNLEIHYSDINPGKDCVELKVDPDRFSYVTAIKTCLRQAPEWILLSEARSIEVKHLLESMSTGTHCLTTIHTDDVRKVPDRIKNMIQDSVIASRVENDVYSFLDAAILVKRKIQDGKIVRYIDQMCFFSREDGERNEIVMVIEDGKVVNKELPEQILKKFAQADILYPFSQKSSAECNCPACDPCETSSAGDNAKEFKNLNESDNLANANESATQEVEERVEEKEEEVADDDADYNDASLSVDVTENNAEKILADNELGGVNEEPSVDEMEEKIEEVVKEEVRLDPNLFSLSYLTHESDNIIRSRRAKFKVKK